MLALGIMIMETMFIDVCNMSARHNLKMFTMRPQSDFAPPGGRNERIANIRPPEVSKESLR